MIDAMLMKVMKEHKELLVNNLLENLFKKLKFSVEVTQVNTRIESLIEKDYLKRNIKNSQIIEYIA